MDDTIPKTVTELENWMKAHCYNFESYSINGNSIYEGFGIDKSGTIFRWYYTERGQLQSLKYFGRRRTCSVKSVIWQLNMSTLDLIKICDVPDY